MAKYKSIIILFSLIFVTFVNICNLSAQNITNYYDIKFHKLNTANGLPSNIATAICQDKKGLIWIGTSNGLVRFDGIKMKIYQYNRNDSNSLPSNGIRSIRIDKEGIIWIATSLKIIKFFPEQEIFVDMNKYFNSKTISKPFEIADIFFDRNDRLWVWNLHKGEYITFDTRLDTLISVLNHKTSGVTYSSNEGMRFCLQDKDGSMWFTSISNCFFCVKLEGNKLKSKAFSTNLKNDIILPSKPACIVEDNYGNIYVTNNGLFVLRYKNKSTYKFEYIDIFEGKKPQSVEDFLIKSAVVDKDNNVWLSTDNYGIIKYNLITNQKTNITLNPINNIGIQSNRANILKDKNNDMWLIFSNSVFCLYDYNKKNFIEFKHNPTNPFSPTPDLFGLSNSIFIDLSSNYWLTTNGSGIEYFSLTKAKFPILKNIPGNINSLSANNVWGIFEDNRQWLWVGVEQSGLNILDFANDKVFRFYDNSTPDFSGFSSIQDIEQISENDFFVGSTPIKRFSFDYKTQKLERIYEFKPNNSDSLSFAAWFSLDIFKGHNGDFWLGSYAGLDQYIKPDKLHPMGSFKHYTSGDNSPLKIAPGWIWNIFEDNQNRLWLACANGLTCFNKDRTKSVIYTNNPKDTTTISINSIKQITQDGKGRIWIATEGGGLNLFIEKGCRFVSYNKGNGFPSDNIFAVFDDNSGNLWMSSTDGIIKFNPETHKTYTFTTEDGLQGNQFTAGSFHKGRSGKIYFGGSNGINHFYPDSIKLSKYIPKIIFTSLKIYNKEVEPNKEYDGKVFITKSITYSDKLVLSYNENVFSLEFTALDFTAAKNIKYSYLLEGVNKNWIETDAENRTLNYTNLLPGEYILKVKSTNSDGVWCDNSTSLIIRITPPFWQTWWFRILVILVIVFSAIAYYKYKTYEIKKKNQELERKVAERTHEVMQQKEEIQQQSEELEATNEELTAQSDALKMSNEELNQKNDELNKKNDEIEKSFKISQVISEFGQRVTSTFDLESINEIVYGYICSIMPTDAFGIGLYKEDKNEIEYIGFIEEGQKIENFTKKLDSENSLTAWCFNNQKVVFVNDLETEHSQYISALPNVSTNKRPHSIIHLPLSTNERKLGIIVVNSFIKNAYTNKDLVHLQSLASYITIAIDNANAYKTVNAQKEKLLELDNFKEAMTGMIVHDLKNPLNAIIGLSSMNPEDEMMQMVNSAGNQMLNLVLNILDVQKFENTNVKLNLKEASLYELADEANRQVSLLIKQKKQILNLNILPQTIIHTDAEVTVRVFVNMLTNAIKYTPSGGSISINQEAILFNEDDYTKNELIPDSIKKQFKFQMPSCLISVSDTGQGIPADKIHLVFEKFGQVEAKKSGGVRSTGLGMTFCKMVVEAHGGAIWITSEVGKGTNFYFTLPFARIDENIQNEKLATTDATIDENTNKLYDIYLIHENGSSELIAESDVASLENELKILVADDDKYSIDVIKNSLSFWGKTFLMFAVGNGKDAVDAAKIILPDIILLDWEMPQLDGLEALKQIKSIPELFKIPVAMVTSRSGNSHIQLAFDAGASDYIKKPIDKTEALFRVQTLANLSELIQISSSSPTLDHSETESLGLVLVVDDVFEIRQMIKQVLQKKYLIIEAENGIEGLNKAKDLIPDIIISDINMPGSDGLELCKSIKSNIATSHIPVILLTAQAGVPSIIAGLEAGADEYLTKPIMADLLQAAVKNQIENRETLRKAFSRIITSEPSDYEFATADEKFIAQCIKTIEENISNIEFHLESFVKEMSMSYSQLYGKLKYLTNLSVAGFIKNIRLKRAKQILDKEKLPLKELIQRVGFENAISFQRIFKREFGISPAEYAKKVHGRS